MRNHRNDKTKRRNETNLTTILKRPKRPQRNDRNYQNNIQHALFYLGSGPIFRGDKKNFLYFDQITMSKESSTLFLQ